MCTNLRSSSLVHKHSNTDLIHESGLISKNIYLPGVSVVSRRVAGRLPEKRPGFVRMRNMYVAVGKMRDRLRRSSGISLPWTNNLDRGFCLRYSTWNVRLHHPKSELFTFQARSKRVREAGERAKRRMWKCYNASLMFGCKFHWNFYIALSNMGWSSCWSSPRWRTLLYCLV